MSGQHNEFLASFLKMRREHNKNPTTAPEPTTAKGKMKARGKTAAPLEDDMAQLSLAKIIEEKPAKKVVCDYFQQLADRLTNEKMR